jgi:hypothetical protein
MARTESIRLLDLLVNTENYRFDPVTGQKEAIDGMIESQGEKLYVLAEHILKNGLNPNDRVQIVPSSHDPTRFIVLEGNRRVIALKLVDNPDLIDNPKYASLKKRFRKLQAASTRLPNDIECTVYDDPTEADVWIKLKHTGQSNGIGTVEWSAQQVQRFEERVEGKSSNALQIINLLRNSSEVPDTVKNGLSSLKITNLDRLLDDPDVRSFLGIDINNGVLQSEIEEKEVVKGLTQIVKDLLGVDFTVKRIYTKDDRMDYLHNFPTAMRPGIKKSVKPWLFTKAGATGAQGKQSHMPKPNPKERKHLIPKSCVLKIDNPKLNAIYYELQRLDLHKFTNAGAVLLRVFIELSLDCYIDKHSPAKVTAGSKLITKVTEVANHMEACTFADKQVCKGIRSAVGNKNDLLGIETWHAYVHNPRFSPTYQNLNITWDNMQIFIEKLWENV